MIYTFFTCFYYVFDLESWPDLTFNRNIIHTICFSFYKYIIQQWNTLLGISTTTICKIKAAEMIVGTNIYGML